MVPLTMLSASYDAHTSWSFVRKTYGDAHSKTGKVSNLVNGPVPLNVPPSADI